MEFEISDAATTHLPSGDMETPSGDSPNSTVPDATRFSKSTLTSTLLGWSLTYSVLPSLETANPRGLSPDLISATTLSVSVSITDKVPDFSFGT